MSDTTPEKKYHRAMGKRNYLIEGVSGAGKTAVCTELQRRGYQARSWRPGVGVSR